MGLRAILKVLAALGFPLIILGCGNGSDPDRISGLSGLWRTTLSAKPDQVPCPEVFPNSIKLGALSENNIYMDGAGVELFDLANRKFEGAADSASSFSVAYKDPRSGSVETENLYINYSEIQIPKAKISVKYCYSRPAYGCCLEWLGDAEKTES